MRSQANAMLRSLLLPVLALLTVAAPAHTVDDLQMRVIINDLGHARVAELRHCTMSDYGTEGYIKQYNLHGMQVGELAVSDETGQQYVVDRHWNIERSRRQKAGRCGIANGDEGPELCWGIGDSGKRAYDIHYTLTRLVNSFDDSDGFIFKFYEADAQSPAHHARIVIEREQGAFSAADTRIWAFQFYGMIKIIEGKIVAETVMPFSKTGEGMVIMAQFDKGLFHPVTTRKGTFDDKVKKPAFEGSDYDLADDDSKGVASVFGHGYKSDDSSLLGTLWELVSLLLQTVLWIGLPIYLIYALFNTGFQIKLAHQNQRLFGNKQGEMTQWSRDVPFDGDLHRTSQVLHAVNSHHINPKNQIAAVVMRMTHMGLISLRRQVDERGQQTALYLVTPPLKRNSADNDKQQQLIEAIHQQMWLAAGSDHLLQPKEMQSYMKEYPVEHRATVSRISQLLSATGRSRGSLQPDEVRQVYGLKKFLQEFTLIDERHVLEVGLWKEYLVFATLFGIAKQVYNDLKKIWPDYTTLAPQDALLMDTDIYTDVATHTLYGMTYVEHYETPQERQERLAREARESRSSGGGGSSSYGGGGGYSGGGGSGFR